MRTADGGAAVREPGPGGAGPPHGMAWQDRLRMAPEVRQAQETAAGGSLAATAGGAGPPVAGRGWADAQGRRQY